METIFIQMIIVLFSKLNKTPRTDYDQNVGGNHRNLKL